MEKVIVYFSVVIAVFALFLSTSQSFFIATVASFACILLIFIGYKIEAFISTNGNALLNRIVYWFTKRQCKYIVLEKHITYTYKGNDSYEFKKEYTILPKTNDLDRFNDRFRWSASSTGCSITPIQKNHSINSTIQQELWTCYDVYFGINCSKNKPYAVGSLISNLQDTNKSAVPFLANTVDKKTKSTTLEVVFPRNSHPKSAKFKIFSTKDDMIPIHEETLAYDNIVGGFKKNILYPRKCWRYVIAWNQP